MKNRAMKEASQQPPNSSIIACLLKINFFTPENFLTLIANQKTFVWLS